jgi:hypothetical protein
MASVAVIGGVVVLEARPVYGYLSARAFGGPHDVTEMVVGFGLASVLCLCSTLIPIRVALKRLQTIER